MSTTIPPPAPVDDGEFAELRARVGHAVRTAAG